MTAVPLDLDAALEAAALPRKTVPVCLRGDLVAQVEDLERQMRELATDRETMADAGRRRKLAEAIEAARDTMHAASLVFVLQGLNRARFQKLISDHPPRKDDRNEQMLGYNVTTFFPALVRACLVEPVVTDQQWERLDAVLSSGQFDQLAHAARQICMDKVDVPFSLAASAALRSSDATSK